MKWINQEILIEKPRDKDNRRRMKWINQEILIEKPRDKDNRSKQNSEDLPAITNDFLFHHRCAVLIY